MHLILHPAAEQELRDALARSEAEFGPQVARQLQRRIDKLGETLMRDPSLGTPSLARARVLPLGRYPYSLVYRVEASTLTVLALMHQSRKPGYWTRRG